MKLSKVFCPQCGGTVEIDKHFETAKCPFCQSSFVIEGVKRKKEDALIVTATSETLPEDVNTELLIHTLFGWDFKQKKFYRNYGGCDMVQLTFERNMKASWCTEELLKKEQEFLLLRENYNQEYLRQLNNQELKPKVAPFPKPFRVGIVMTPIASMIFSTIMLAAGLTDSSASFLAFFPIPIMLIAIALIIFFSMKGGRVKRRRQEKYDKDFKENNIKLSSLLNNINEIAKWASEQMTEKFGTKVEIDFK